MGNCLCPHQRKSSGGDSPYVAAAQPHVNTWIACSDFSSVPETEEKPTEIAEDSPEEVPYRPVLNALNLPTEEPQQDGFETAPEENDEEEDQAKDDDGSQVSSTYLTSDDREEKEASRPSPIPSTPEHPASDNEPALLSVNSAADTVTDDEEVTPQLLLNAEDQPVRPMPTPIRKYEFPPSLNLEKLAFSNGRARRKKIGRLWELKKVDA